MSVKISDLNSNIYVRAALFSCVQYNLCAYNVMYMRSMLFTLRCHLNVPPSLLFLGNLRTLPFLPRNLCGSIPLAYQFFSNMYTKKLTFIPQYHISVLLQSHVNLWERLYIWSMMNILPYSCNKMFHIHKQRLSYFYIFWLLAAPCRLLRRLRLLYSRSGSDLPTYYLPPFIRHLRVCALNVIYVRSMLSMCVQCYLCVYNVILCVFSDIYVFSMQLKCYQVKLIKKNDS